MFAVVCLFLKCERGTVYMYTIRLKVGLLQRVHNSSSSDAMHFSNVSKCLPVDNICTVAMVAEWFQTVVEPHES